MANLAMDRVLHPISTSPNLHFPQLLIISNTSGKGLSNCTASIIYTFTVTTIIAACCFMGIVEYLISS